MIRAAEDKDYELIKSYVPKLIKDSDFGKFFEGYELTKFMFEQYTENPESKFCIIITDDQEDVGFAMFDMLTWPFIDKEVKFSRLSFIYMEPEARKKGLMDDVLLAFEYWSDINGADYCTLGTKLPKKKGYKKVETVYMKEINRCLK